MQRRSLIAAAVAVLSGACSSRAPIESCDEDLHGVYADGSGARWVVMDSGSALEGYPMFDDFHALAGSASAAPRAFDLRRPAMAGDMRRRYTRAGDYCTQRAAMHVTGCRADQLEIVVGDPLEPTAWKPCASRTPDSHVERWTRLE